MTFVVILWDLYKKIGSQTQKIIKVAMKIKKNLKFRKMALSKLISKQKKYMNVHKALKLKHSYNFHRESLYKIALNMLNGKKVVFMRYASSFI